VELRAVNWDRVHHQHRHQRQHQRRHQRQHQRLLHLNAEVFQ
jgi:hypothetical protein